jgi:hypothetical protein
MPTEEDAEELLSSLPQLPPRFSVTTTNLIVAEWLGEDDRRTGEELVQWANERRSGWARYALCRHAGDILRVIDDAKCMSAAERTSPILHIEGHGDLEGLCGAGERLEWSDLTASLQVLNIATRFNLTVFVAACEGYAALLSLCNGPVCPAISIAGPSTKVHEGELVNATKEFYRRWTSGSSDYSHAIASASSELENGAIESAYGPLLFYEGFFSALIKKAKSYPVVPLSDSIQHLWNNAFCIGQFPENQQRFGVDVATACKKIDAFYGR